MKLLEIIHLRLAGDSPRNLVEAIRGSVDSQADPTQVRVYRHARIAGDLIIHLHRDLIGGSELTSDLGARLASVLREYGMVEHSVWQELA